MSLRNKAVISAIVVLFSSLAAGQNAFVGGAGLAIIDTTSSKVVAKVGGGNASVSPNGKKVYACDYSNRSVLSLAPSNGQLLTAIAVGSHPYWIAFSPDSRTAYVTNNGGDKTVSVIDTASDTVTATVPVSGVPVGIAVSPNGSKVYVTMTAGFVDGFVTVIDASTNTVSKNIKLPNASAALVDPLGLDFSPDGSTAYIADNRQGILFVINVATDTVTGSIKVSPIINTVAVTPDGTKAYVANFAASIAVLRTIDNTIVKTITLAKGTPQGMSFTPDGSKLFVANQGIGAVHVIDTATDTILSTINTDNQPTGYGVFIQRQVAGPSVPPTINATVNGFSYGPGFAPGSFIQIYGSNLASTTATFSTTLPTMLGSVSVLFNNQPIPLYYVSPGQINAQIPTTIAAGNATLTISNSGTISAASTITILQAAPGIPTYLTGNITRAAARNQDNSINGPSNPAAAGSVMTLYFTGIGPVDNPVASGQPAPLTILSRATLPVGVTIGGQFVIPSFAGLTPGSIGLAQVNVAIPSLATGDYPVIITVNGVASNAPVVSISR